MLLLLLPLFFLLAALCAGAECPRAVSVLTEQLRLHRSSGASPAATDGFLSLRILCQAQRGGFWLTVNGERTVRVPFDLPLLGFVQLLERAVLQQADDSLPGRAAFEGDHFGQLEGQHHANSWRIASGALFVARSNASAPSHGVCGDGSTPVVTELRLLRPMDIVIEVSGAAETVATSSLSALPASAQFLGADPATLQGWSAGDFTDLVRASLSSEALADYLGRAALLMNQTWFAEDAEALATLAWVGTRVPLATSSPPTPGDVATWASQDSVASDAYDPAVQQALLQLVRVQPEKEQQRRRSVHRAAALSMAIASSSVSGAYDAVRASTRFLLRCPPCGAGGCTGGIALQFTEDRQLQDALHTEDDDGRLLFSPKRRWVGSTVMLAAASTASSIERAIRAIGMPLLRPKLDGLYNASGNASSLTALAERLFAGPTNASDAETFATVSQEALSAGRASVQDVLAWLSQGSSGSSGSSAAAALTRAWLQPHLESSGLEPAAAVTQGDPLASDVVVRVSNSGDALCSPNNEESYVTIELLADRGPLPLRMSVLQHSGAEGSVGSASLTVSQRAGGIWGVDALAVATPLLVTVASSDRGTRPLAECGGGGTCDEVSGRCVCHQQSVTLRCLHRDEAMFKKAGACPSVTDILNCQHNLEGQYSSSSPFPVLSPPASNLRASFIVNAGVSLSSNFSAILRQTDQPLHLGAVTSLSGLLADASLPRNSQLATSRGRVLPSVGGIGDCGHVDVPAMRCPSSCGAHGRCASVALQTSVALGGDSSSNSWLASQLSSTAASATALGVWADWATQFFAGGLARGQLGYGDDAGSSTQESQSARMQFDMLFATSNTSIFSNLHRMCFCEYGFSGPRCDVRECPRSFRTDRECSGDRGSCDRATGKCSCRPGYSGSACERTNCPRDKSSGLECSGHGRCRFSDLDQIGVCECDGDAPFAGAGAGSASLTVEGWSSWPGRSALAGPQGHLSGSRLLGPVMGGAGFTGADCSLRRCPVGPQRQEEIRHWSQTCTSSSQLTANSSATADQVGSAEAARRSRVEWLLKEEVAAEVQLVSCTGLAALSDATLSWALGVPGTGEVTGAMAWSVTAAEVEATLRNVTGLGDVIVVAADASRVVQWNSSACACTTAGASFALIFADHFGDVPTLSAVVLRNGVVLSPASSITGAVSTVRGQNVGLTSALVSVSEAIRGGGSAPPRLVECSGRGTCDRSTGVCRCGANAFDHRDPLNNRGACGV